MKDKSKKPIIVENVIVSMTSFPKAIQFAIKAVKSILNGSILPQKLVLYLTLSSFGEEGIPIELKQLEKDYSIFEIHDHESDIRSYRKLIPALKEFPNSVIVTVDDDVDYNKNFLKLLIKWHKKLPNTIIAHRVRKVTFEAPYKKWKKYKWRRYRRYKVGPSFFNIQIGVGGVLYPTGALNKGMIDSEEYLKIAPTTDDIWFWAAGVANNVPVMPIPFGKNKPKDLDKPKEISLRTINFRNGKDVNYDSMRKILISYDKISERLGINQSPIISNIDIVYFAEPELYSNSSQDNNKINIKNNIANTSLNDERKSLLTDFDFLKYSLRSIEKYANWINNIFIVIDSELPEWLNISNPRINIIKSKELCKTASQVTYNYTDIEFKGKFINSIPGLSEKFLIANNYMFLNKPIIPFDFFSNDGLPIIHSSKNILMKYLRFLQLYILKKGCSIKNDPNLNTIISVFKKYNRFFYMKTPHTIEGRLKSSQERLMLIFSNDFNRLSNRGIYIDENDLYAYVSLAENRGHLQCIDSHYSLEILKVNDKNIRKIIKTDPKIFHISKSSVSHQKDYIKITSFLNELFTQKSQFEK